MTARVPARPPAPTGRADVAAAVRATYVAFLGTGITMATWVSRVPQLRDHLRLTAGEVGLVLLAVSGGAVLALPSTGVIVHRWGTRRTVRVMSVLLSAGLVVVGLGDRLGVVTVVLGFVLVGFGNGAWDVAMNVHAAQAERALGRSIMPRFHAGFSVGTVAGALLGALLVAVHVPVLVHLAAVAVLVVAVVPLGVRCFLPDPAADHTVTADDATARQSHPLTRWREPRTLLIGVFMLAFAFAEGAGNDWSSIALIDAYRLPAAVGTLGYAVFLTAMTATRWFGPAVLDRRGRVPVLRALAVVSLAGLALFVFAPVAALAFVGVVLWGAGVSLGFPAGMSAASQDPAAAAARASVVASIGYCAFLGGPPLIGFLGASVGVHHALAVLALPLAVAVVVAPALREDHRTR